MNSNSTPPQPGRLHPTVPETLICLLLGVAALLLYTLGRPVEFHGDDDYLYPASFALIADAVRTLDWHSLQGLVTGLANLAGLILCAPRHAPLPALIHALFYCFSIGLGLPFSLSLIHLPIAMMSAGSVVLLYKLLRRYSSLGRWLCFAAALLLLSSPLFTKVSRGIGTYFAACIPLITLTGLWALLSLRQKGQPRWWMGLALAQIILADLLWFITLPLLLGSFVLAAPDRRQTFSQLFSKKISGPVIITITLLLLGTGIAHSRGLPTPILTLLGEHGRQVTTGSPIIASPAFLAECLAHLMGLLFPALLAMGLAVWWRTGRPLRAGDLATFGLTGTAAYGLIFYGLTSEQIFVKHCYQIYLLLPLLLLTVTLIARIRSDHRRLAGAILALLLLFEGLACVTFIWKIPISPLSAIYQDQANGTWAPNRGTKAVGYLTRRWIEHTWRQNAAQPITVYAERYTMSYAIFSGLNAREQGRPFIPEFGPNRPLRLQDGSALRTIAGLADSVNAPSVYFLDLTDNPALSIDRCFTYTIRSSSPRNGSALLIVRPHNGQVALPILPNGLSMEELESGYDREYNQYRDFFP